MRGSGIDQKERDHSDARMEICSHVADNTLVQLADPLSSSAGVRGGNIHAILMFSAILGRMQRKTMQKKTRGNSLNLNAKGGLRIHRRYGYPVWIGLCVLLFASSASAQTIDTLVGAGVNVYGGDGVPATESGLNQPMGVVFNSSGTMYIADSSNNRIRAVSNGIIDTLVGTGIAGWSASATRAAEVPVNNPVDVVPGPNGSIVYSDLGNHRIRMVDRNGIVSTLVGDGTPAVAGDGLSGTQASVMRPMGLVYDGSGNLFWADQNAVRVLSNNVVRTIAGTGGSGFSGDGGPPASAKFNDIRDLALRSGGSALYVADTGNHRVRIIQSASSAVLVADSTSLTVSTFAGNGTTGSTAVPGSATATSFHTPVALTVDENDDLYVANAGTGQLVRIHTNGTMDWVLSTSAQELPFVAAGLTEDASGDLYYAQGGYHVIRYNKVTGTPSPSESVVAGVGVRTYGGEGMPAGMALLVTPTFMTTDLEGRLVFSDYGAHRIRRVDHSGIVSTIAGSGIASGTTYDGSPATEVPLRHPTGLDYNAVGELFVAQASDHVVQVVHPPPHEIFRIIGTGSAGFVSEPTHALWAALNSPEGLVADGSRNVYFSDRLNHRIRMMDWSGEVSTIVGNGTAAYVGNGSAGIEASLNHPMGLSLTASGELLIADEWNHRVRLLSPTGTIYTVAGDGTAGYAGDGTSAVSTSLYQPRHAVMDASGNIYIADYSNHRIRKVSRDGIITTVAGTGTAGYSGDGGQAIHANLNHPFGLLMDATGNLLIVDRDNGRIRRIDFRNLDPAVVNTSNLRLASHNLPGSVTLTILDSGNGTVVPGRIRNGALIRADMTLLDRSHSSRPLIVSVSWPHFSGIYSPDTLRINNSAASATATPGRGILFDCTASTSSISTVSFNFAVTGATSTGFADGSPLGTVLVVDATDPGAAGRSITSSHPGNLVWTGAAEAGVVSTTLEIDNDAPVFRNVEILVSHDQGQTYETLDFPSVSNDDVLLVSATIQSDSLAGFSNDIDSKFNDPTKTRFGEILASTAAIAPRSATGAIFSATVFARATDNPLPLSPQHIILKARDNLGNETEQDIGVIGVKASGPNVVASYLYVNDKLAPDAVYSTGPDVPPESVAEVGIGDRIQFAVDFGGFNVNGPERLTGDFSPLFPPAKASLVNAIVPSATSMAGSVFSATWTFASVDLGAAGVSNATFAHIDTIGKTPLTLSPAGLIPGVTPKAVPGISGLPGFMVQAGAVPQSATTIRVTIHDADSPYPQQSLSTLSFTMDTQPPEATASVTAQPPLRRTPHSSPTIPQRVKGGDRLSYTIDFTNPLIAGGGDDLFASGITPQSVTADLRHIGGPSAASVSPTTVISQPRTGHSTLHTAQFDVEVSPDLGKTDASSITIAQITFEIRDDVDNALEIVSSATPLAVDNQPPYINTDGARVLLASGTVVGPDGTQIAPGNPVPSGSLLNPDSTLRIESTNISDFVDAALDLLVTPGTMRVFFGDGIGGIYEVVDSRISSGGGTVYPTFELTVPESDELDTTLGFPIVIAASDTLGNTTQKELRPTFEVNGAPWAEVSVWDESGTIIEQDAAGKTIQLTAGRQSTIVALGHDADGIRNMEFDVDPALFFDTDTSFDEFGAVDVEGRLTITPTVGSFLGPATVTVTVTDGNLRTTTSQLTLTVDQAPSFTSATAAIYEEGQIVQEIVSVTDSIQITEKQRLLLTVTGQDSDASDELTLSATGAVFSLPQLATATFGGKVVTATTELPIQSDRSVGSIQASLDLTPTYRTVLPSEQQISGDVVFAITDGVRSATRAVTVHVLHAPTTPTITVTEMRTGGSTVPVDSEVQVNENSLLEIWVQGEDVSGEILSVSFVSSSGVGSLSSNPSIDTVAGKLTFEPDLDAADLPDGSPNPSYDSPVDPSVFQFTVSNESGRQNSVSVTADVANVPSPPTLETRATLDNHPISPSAAPVPVVHGQRFYVHAVATDTDRDIVAIEFDAPPSATVKSISSGIGAATYELSLTFDETFPIGEQVDISVVGKDSKQSSEPVLYSFEIVELSERLLFVTPFQGVLRNATGSSFVSAATEIAISETDTLDLLIQARSSVSDATVRMSAQGSALATGSLSLAQFAGKSIASGDTLPFSVIGQGLAEAGYRINPGLRLVPGDREFSVLSLDLTASDAELTVDHTLNIRVRNVFTTPSMSVSEISVDGGVPTIATDTITIDEGSELAILVRADDAGAQKLVLDATGVPSGAAFEPVSGTPPLTARLEYTPGPNASTVTPHTVIFSATNEGGVSVSLPLQISVTDRFNEPQIDVSLIIDDVTKEITEPIPLDTLELMHLIVASSDPDPSDVLVLSVSGTALSARELQLAVFARKSVKKGDTLPFEFRGKAPTGPLSIYPGVTANLPGDPPKMYSVELAVSDGVFEVTRELTIEVSATSAPPQLRVSKAILDGTPVAVSNRFRIAEGQTLQGEVSAIDPSGLPLSLSHSEPSGAMKVQIDSTVGQATGTFTLSTGPVDSATSPYAITFIAENERAEVSILGVTVEVTDIDYPAQTMAELYVDEELLPAVDIYEATVGHTVRAVGSAYDPDKAAVFVSVAGPPPDSRVTPVGGLDHRVGGATASVEVEFEPEIAGEILDITFVGGDSLTDAPAGDSMVWLRVHINSGNLPPELTIEPEAPDPVRTGETLSLLIYVEDPENDLVTLAAYFDGRPVFEGQDGFIVVDGLYEPGVVAGLLVFQPDSDLIGNHLLMIEAADEESTNRSRVSLNVIEGGTPTPTPSPSPTPKATSNQILLSQGYGGTTSNNRRHVEDLRIVAKSPFPGLPSTFADLLETTRLRSANTCAGDIDGDGVEDIVVGFGPSGFGSIMPSIVVAWRTFGGPEDRPSTITSKGVFVPGALNSLLRNIHGALNLTAGDFVGAGRPQVIAAQGLGGSSQIRALYLVESDGRQILDIVGTFQGLTGEAVQGNSSGGTALAAGDVDGDGLDELIVGQMNGASATTLFQVLNLIFTDNRVQVAGRTPPVAGMPSAFRGLGGVNLAVGDVDGDGDNEIIVASAGLPDGANNPDWKSFVRVFDVQVDQSHNITSLQPFSGRNPVQVFGPSVNPSGAVDVAAGDLDGDSADELLVSTQAVIELDAETGAVTVLHAAPTNLVKGINLEFSAEGELTGISPAVTQFRAFGGDFAPTSGAVNVEIYPGEE